MLLSLRSIPVCTLQPSSNAWKTPLNVSSDSAGHEVLAHRVWYLLVGLLVLVTGAALRQQIIIYSSHFQLAVGSMSPLLTTSGVFSAGINAIDGRYGYVTVTWSFLSLSLSL